MNKQEALYLPVRKEGFIFSKDDSECKRHYRTLDGEEVSSSFKANSKEELLDQLKPVVPKFVAEWIDTLDEHGLFGLDYDIVDESVHDWVYENHDYNAKKLHLAYLYGYTVEQEKLYTVEIPNPNIIGYEHTVLMKNVFNQIVIRMAYGNNWRTDKCYRLTESEIKKDFEWAWKWSKPLEEN